MKQCADQWFLLALRSLLFLFVPTRSNFEVRTLTSTATARNAGSLIFCTTISRMTSRWTARFRIDRKGTMGKERTRKKIKKKEQSKKKKWIHPSQNQATGTMDGRNSPGHDPQSRTVSIILNNLPRRKVRCLETLNPKNVHQYLGGLTDKANPVIQMFLRPEDAVRILKDIPERYNPALCACLTSDRSQRSGQ